jgi:hypothetical protein
LKKKVLGFLPGFWCVFYGRAAIMLLKQHAVIGGQHVANQQKMPWTLRRR